MHPRFFAQRFEWYSFSGSGQSLKKGENKVKKHGKTITVTEGELFAYTESQQKLVATMIGTMMSVYDRPGIES